MKNNLLLQFVESVWFKCLILYLIFRIVFPSRKQFSYEILLNLVKKTKNIYVLPKLTNYIYAIQALTCECQRVHMIYLFLL
jgi:hypothetical protein